MNHLLRLKNLPNLSKRLLTTTRNYHENRIPIASLNFCSKSNFCISKFWAKQEQFQENEQQPISKQTSSQKEAKTSQKLEQQKKPICEGLNQSPYLRRMAEQLLQQATFFIGPLYHSRSYHYASYLLPVVRLLHEKNVIKETNVLKNYFREVKNSIKPSEERGFTPKSAVRLMEEFSLIEFDGDESTALSCMLDYVESNHMYFTQVELQRFKAAYRRIMVRKAMGPVKFRPLKLQKNYQSEMQRKANLIKKTLIETMEIREHQVYKELVVDYQSDKKWIIIKFPSRNLSIITYPKSFELLSEEEVYTFVYDLKQTLNNAMAKMIRQKSKAQLQSSIVQVEIKEFTQNHPNTQTQYKTERGIVYRQKRKIIDEMEKLEEIKKLSLKEQIQKMKEKKKQLKEKQKKKGKSKTVQDIQNEQIDSKVIDFIATIKHHINQAHEQSLLRINKRGIQGKRLKRKQRRKLQKNLNQDNQQKQDLEQNDEDFQNQDHQMEDQKEQEQVAVQSQKDIQRKSAMMEKMKLDLQAFNQKLLLAREKQVNSNQQITQPQILTELLRINHSQNNIQNSFQTLLKNHSLKEIKEFVAYVELIQSLDKAIDEIKKPLLSPKVNLNSQKPNPQQNEPTSSQQRTNLRKFESIRDNWNEPLDTNIRFNLRLQEIFRKWMSKPNKGKGTRIDPQEKKSEQVIWIIPEEELLNSMMAQKRQDVLQKDAKLNTSHEKNNSEAQEKERILSNLFDLVK